VHRAALVVVALSATVTTMSSAALSAAG
jgi:hypothetical protein